MNWLCNNLFWLVPSICSIVFAIATFCMIAAQHKWQKNAKLRDQAFMEEQRKLQTTQLCIELYDARLHVYDGFTKFFNYIIGEGRKDNALAFEFHQLTRGKQFLFGSDINEYAKKVFTDLNKLIRAASLLKGSEAKGDQQKFEKLINEETQLVDNLTAYRQQLDDVFSPYLDFSGFTIQKQ
ncbi:hypothetical protein SDC9_74994 [bioreactor metagenome]|mgnify:CR=1 FL=1|uniref:Uncharacterized protein n=1 Tax=bioreactor metagenome TaxID=1076179 RepID=A0A644YKF7_9ZZZZ